MGIDTVNQLTCETCGHSSELYMASWNPPKIDLRCFRIGLTLRGEIDHHDKVGRSCRFETDSLPEPQRPKLEKCGKERRHWTPKTEIKAT